MRPANLKTTRPSFRSKIFLDGGDPQETGQIIDLLGFLDGQTTNPTLISKNPKAAEKLARGEKFTQEEILNFYKNVVQEISRLIPNGSVSVEVYADANTTAEEMLVQGKGMFSWIPNAHIKFPTNKEGLAAAKQTVKEGLRVNMTLVFSQEQAAAVYAATKSDHLKPSLPGYKNIFVSPFVGRLDDIGENGMDLIKNIIQMYRKSDHHVAILTASVRSLNHFLYALALGSDIITAPFKILKVWAEGGFQVPCPDFIYDPGNLKSIPYQEFNLSKDWHEFNIAHDLTDAGIEKFSHDWNSLINPLQ